jgi:protease I
LNLLGRFGIHEEGPMEQKLRGKKVAILVTHGFEQVELTEPQNALQQAGADTKIVSPAEGKVKGWNFTDWGDEVSVDVPLSQARAQDYDALHLPGGVMNPDQLRIIPEALAFVREFFESQKPVAVICHGPWTLIDAGVVAGRRMTSWPSVRTDLVNAGADWVDEPAVVDQGLVSSRKPEDIPQFSERMIEEFAEGRHAAQRAA